MQSFLPLIKSEWRLLGFGFTMTFCSCFGQTYFIALFGGELRADLGLSHSEFGAVYSAATLASAALLLKTGGLIDRVDLKRFSMVIAFGLALAAAGLALSNSLLVLFLAILALRHLGQGLMGMAGATTMVRYLPDSRGKANAISGMGYSISEALLPSIVVAMLAVLGWRETWLAWSLLLGLGLPLLLHFFLRGHEQRHREYLVSVEAPSATSESAARQRQWTRGEVLRDPLFYLFMPALLATPILFTGFMFHQVHLVETKGWSLALWGSLYTVYALTATAMKLATGLLVDRFGAIRLVPLMVIPLGIALLVLASGDGIAVAVVFMLLLGITVGGYATVSSPFFAEKYGTLHMGEIKSVTTAVMVFSSAISPVLMGWSIDAGISIERQALVGAGLVLFALSAAWVARSRALAA